MKREHFGYNPRGAAALRAYRALERAVSSDVSAIALPPAAASGEHNPDQHEG